MTIEEKARAYDKALENAKKWAKNPTVWSSDDICQKLFPELLESEDEKTRKELLKFLESVWHLGKNAPLEKWDKSDCSKWIAWLEKQGEQKPTDMVGPRFKVGDWITFYGGEPFKILKIEAEQNGVLDYLLLDQNGHNSYYNKKYVDKCARLWNIQDAKDGDVLAFVTDEEDLWIMIYWSLYEPYEGHVHYHALLVNDDFGDKGTCCTCIDNLKPATKEQRDLLFQKMKEAGYGWDAEKKELKQLSQPEVTKTSDKGWSEEDEKILSLMQKIIRDSDLSSKKADELSDWLNSLKDRF